MSETDHLAFMRDPRFADLVASALPAWLWAIDATRVLWTNASGAALLGAATVGALQQRQFDRKHPAARQVARLADALPPDAARRDRLQGFAAGVGRLLTCSCARLALADGTPAILIAATEPAGPRLPFPERIRRLLDGFDGPFAAFSRDGRLVHAAPEIRGRLGGIATLAAAGAAELAATAHETGRAVGETPLGLLTLERIGTGKTEILLAILATVPTPQAAEEKTQLSEASPARLAPDPSPAHAPPPDASPVRGRPPAQPSAERRQPLRFVWQIDQEGRFTAASDDFIAMIGPAVAAKLGRPWTEIADEFALDPEGRLAHALASHDTFSGIPVAWPIEGTPDRLTAELSGLPVLDRDRNFRGYRGFGVCRDVARLAAIAAARRPPFVAPRDAEPAGSSEPEQAAAARPAGADTAAAETESHDPAPQPTEVSARPAAESAEPIAPPPIERPQLTIVPAAKNVVPFRPAPPAAAEKRPALTPVERSAFQEIAKTLGASVEGDETPSEGGESAALADQSESGADAADPTEASAPATGNGERAVLDRVPVGVLICRGDQLLHANRAVLDWTGYEDLEAISAAGGLERLLAEPGLGALGEPGGSGQNLALTTRRGKSLAVQGRLFSVAWHDGTALLIVLARVEAEERVKAAEDAARAAGERVRANEAALAGLDERLKAAELALRSAETAARELESVLETATDGVVVVDRDGVILASNRSAEALFGYESHELIDRSFVDLFAPESQRAAHDYLNGLMREGVASVLNDGREVIGRVQQGGLIPLFMTIGRIAEGKFCIVFRDITQWKRAEEDLTNAKREAEKASSAKSDVLAKVSHEIRTPLNAIIGFAEVMMEERFGPIGNERYRQYLKDIRTSGEHVISLVNDLLDLSKIEAGKLDLTFVSVNINNVVQQCVAIMQPQANRERIIIRTSLLPTLPPVVADERSIRQIVLNLMSNSIKFTGAGGQVIVSTALTDQGEAVLRVRDTGIGMSEKEIETALEPFRQVATSGRASAGTGLGLPLTKVLAEANRASFTIKSAIDAGTLVEIAFPATRVLAE
jgi:PAS domain S-box-containing protein